MQSLSEIRRTLNRKRSVEGPPRADAAHVHWLEMIHSDGAIEVLDVITALELHWA